MDWISVKDRLPEEKKLVIVADYARTWEVGVGRIESIGSGYYQWAVGEADGVVYFHGREFDRVTHWMPLPEPPEDNND